MTSSGEQFYSGFSCPDRAIDPELLQYVVTQHSKGVLEGFLERYSGSISSQSSGLVEYLAECANGSLEFDAVWNIEFGDILSAVAEENAASALRSAAAIALQMHPSNVRPNWEAQFDSDTNLRVGRCLLPSCTRIEMRHENDSIVARTSLENRWADTELISTAGRWSGKTAKVLPEIEHTGGQWNILTAPALSPLTRRQLLNIETYSYDESDDSLDVLVATARNATHLIENGAVKYLAWVNQVVRALVPLPKSGNLQNSASGNFWPGTITVTNQSDALVLAEMLVHEATHQYLYIARRLGPIDDGSDDKLYFSPFRQIGRPIIFIVFAYHAFGNVLLFFDALRQSGVVDERDRGSLNLQIDKLRLQLDVLERSLRETSALTPIGRALWQPVCEQVHEC